MKSKEKAIVVSFCVLLYSLFFFNIGKPNDQLSYSERRLLAQFPKINEKTIFQKTAMEDFDAYATDQFIFRELFRKIKAEVDFKYMHKMDNNGIFVIDNMVFQAEYPMNMDKINYLCDKINYVWDNYLKDKNMNVYYAIVPDKNYYISQSEYLTLDYSNMISHVREWVDRDIQYINIVDALSISDYYATDSHWRQERLSNVVDALGKGLDVDFKFNLGDYQQNRYSPFYGVYYGRAALTLPPDELIYLENDLTKKAIVTSLEKPNEILSVYDKQELGKMDPYYLFMEGPASLVKIENPTSLSERELVIFRDSFASSLTPLLLNGYRTITLIDLRYLPSNYLEDDIVSKYVEWNDQDVLFLYSVTMFNNSDSIK